MCEQCLAATKGWRIFPSEKGPILVQATRDGHEMKRYQWGLVTSNDPFVIWDTLPLPDPGDPPDEDNPPDGFREAEEDFIDALTVFREAFVMAPTDGHHLYMAAVEAGFDPKEDGFECWLFDRMGRAVQERPNGDPDACTPDKTETSKFKGQLGQ